MKARVPWVSPTRVRSALRRRRAVAPERDPQVTAAVELAKEAMRDRDWPGAVDAWEQARQRSSSPDPAVLAGLARALRAGGDRAAGCEVAREGRELYPDDPALLLEDARATLYLYRRAAEDVRHGHKARLLDIERRLSAHHRRLAADAIGAELLTVLGELSLELRKWEHAVELWEDVATRYPDRRPQAMLKLATAFRGAGEFERARRALEVIGGNEVGSRAYRDEVRRLTTAAGKSQAGEVAAQARLRLAVGDVTAGEQLIEGALLVRGYDRHQLAHMTPLLTALIDGVRAMNAYQRSSDPSTSATSEYGVSQHQPVAAGEVDPGAEVVHVSGFLYSGSGAVLDHLRSHPRVERPFASRETGFLKKPGHLALLLGEDRRRPERFPLVVVESVLASVFGFGQTGRPLVAWFSRSAEEFERFMDSTGRLVSDLRAAWERALPNPVDADDVEAALRRYLGRVLTELTTPGRVALLNNAIVAHELDRVRLTPGARAVAVVRDPRDQYVSQRLESPNSMTCDAFIEMMVTRYRKFEGVLAGPAGSVIRPVRFEDFVEDASVRDDLLRWLGLAPDASVGARTFDPDRSRANIGIHAGHVDQDEISRVERALMEMYRRLPC